jgi:PKD repeat protein
MLTLAFNQLQEYIYSIDPSMKHYTRKPFAFACLFTVMVLMAGCKEAPEACYTVTSNLVDVNTDVAFENCTEPVATSYTWDFADGTTSNAVNPVHRFTQEGQYLVSLDAKGSENVHKTLITAGQRLLSLTEIQSLPALNNGSPWDAGTNPDIAVRFSKGGTVAYQSPTQDDVAWTFPMAVQMPSTDLVLTPEDWTVTVLDMDGGTEEVMATFAVDFETVVPTGTLSIDLDTGASSLQITYTLRN